MYTSQEREQILNRLVESFRKREEILAVILVGSGADGFRDRYSDIDLVVVTAETEMSKVYKATAADVNRICPTKVAESNFERSLQLFLLENYLEIDVGYSTPDSLCARRELFRVLFDRTGKAGETMARTWNARKDASRGATEPVDMARIIESIDDNLWYSILHCVVAFRRGEKYRCWFELNEIRRWLIDLITKRSGLESKRFRQLHLLGNEDLARIDALFACPQSYEELAELLRFMLKGLFEEFEYWQAAEDIRFTMNRDYLEKFIDDNAQ